MRMTPKTRVNPLETRNMIPARVNPFMVCTMN